MKLNRAELRKIIYDFNSISNRLLQADFNDYTNVVSKFVAFIKNTPIILDYIKDCGHCEQDLKQEFDEISRSYGRSIFSLGDADAEEIRNVFGIVNYIAENGIEIHYGVAVGYSSSKKFQDKIKGFNDRVVMVLIRHIESYLTKIGIDMGIDEKVTYSITVQNGQVNIANDNASITATSTVGIDAAQLEKLVQAVRIKAIELPQEDAEVLESSLEVIEDEIKSGKPRKGFLKTAVSGLKMIKGTAEFAAAVATLIQFVQPLL
ncbi:hypothetical protein [Anaerobium acetethylicum]|uniref:Uncharacterized protein n=1 Tax=Anaerobium acetethylicum TaxID=1619234 RepID=A0A1D3TYM4_9FIRM|nr:hypothetical protein [Anaerobium acetethylicum]SCP99568.1 hypothetical protein SAMN05421730_104616 [Anaerobium acetethylicum]